MEGSSLGAENRGNLQSKRDGSQVEAIQHFRVPNDKLPQTFRLLNVQGLPQWANTSCVSIGDVIQVTIVPCCKEQLVGSICSVLDAAICLWKYV